MTDVVLEASVSEVEANPYMGAAARVADKLDTVVKMFPVQSQEGSTMVVDKYKPDIRDTLPTQAQGFRFWGGIDNGFRWSRYGNPTAIIKDLRIPIATNGVEVRGKLGMGSAIVKTWEDAMREEGVTDFAATNIKDEEALKFWSKMGYVVPVDQQHKAIPYCVVKTI